MQLESCSGSQLESSHALPRHAKNKNNTSWLCAPGKLTRLRCTARLRLVKGFGLQTEAILALAVHQGAFLCRASLCCLHTRPVTLRRIHLAWVFGPQIENVLASVARAVVGALALAACDVAAERPAGCRSPESSALESFQSRARVALDIYVFGERARPVSKTYPRSTSSEATKLLQLVSSRSSALVWLWLMRKACCPTHTHKRTALII